MFLQPLLAKKIIAEVKKMYEREVIIVSTDGLIIASTNDERVGLFHEGALICAKEKRNVIITKEDEKRLKGVKAGLNLPVFSERDVIAVFGLTGEPAEIQPYGELLRKMTELFIKESWHLEQTQWRERMLESFMIDWLQLKEWSPGFLEKAQLLGVDLTSLRQMILIQGHEWSPGDIDHMTRAWKSVFPSDLFIRWGNERILINHEVPKHEQKEQLLRQIQLICSLAERLGNSRAAAGVGRAVSGSGLPQSYEQAEKALAVSLKRKTAVCEEDLKLDMCLTEISPGTRHEFPQRVFQEALRNEELMNTIRTLFHYDLSLKKTAEEMHIHINTLRYRLSKAEQLTGLSFQRTEDIVTMYVALYFLGQDTK
ncbi:CdaR family transcriptional regulator [Bacillus velezensis]|uniref:CdaR family transcriptional regulator n=1 Tax=Bacillus halotolerans TaxID=260554 RepID=UPI0024C19C12|nr:sugar diacid recognition domain-containing protein [Bacillus halotolerans]WHY23344.1 sugar diacid recognition domain-containing protein [Bacillus halotolerans]